MVLPGLLVLPESAGTHLGSRHLLRFDENVVPETPDRESACAHKCGRGTGSAGQSQIRSLKEPQYLNAASFIVCIFSGSVSCMFALNVLLTSSFSARVLPDCGVIQRAVGQASVLPLSRSPAALVAPVGGVGDLAP